MGVIQFGVGIIENTSPNYATVISILNKNHKSMPKSRNQIIWFFIWNGKSTGFVQLVDVPRLAAIRKETPLLPVDNL
jgi:rod shape-determining protein MreC